MRVVGDHTRTYVVRELTLAVLCALAEDDMAMLRGELPSGAQLEMADALDGRQFVGMIALLSPMHLVQGVGAQYVAHKRSALYGPAMNGADGAVTIHYNAHQQACVAVSSGH